MPSAALFEPVAFGQLTRHAVRGFRDPIPAICYDGRKLRSGVPLGGLGTGYLDLLGTGHLRRAAILGHPLHPQQADGALLELRPSLTSNEGRICLDAQDADVAVLPHFPVCDMRYALPSGTVVWLRTFATMLPGDADGSNVPATVFEIQFDGEPCEGYLCLSLRLGENPFEQVERHTLETGPAAGARLVMSDRHRRRGELLLAWLAAPEGSGIGYGEDGLKLSLYAPARPRGRYRAVFAWHVPWILDVSGDWRRQRYAGQFTDVAEVGGYIAAHHARILERTLAWQASVYQSGEPDWLCNAMVQSLHSFTKRGIWFDEARPDQWYGPDGLFAFVDGPLEACVAEPVTARQHGHIATMLLWPRLEAASLLALAHYQLRDGEIPYCLGSGNSLREPRFQCQHPLVSAQFIQQAHRCLLRTGDLTLRERLWPSMVDAMHHALSLDTDGDALINEHPHAMPGDDTAANHYYQDWPWFGTSAYVAGNWLATLRVMLEVSTQVGDEEVRQQAEQLLARGLRSFRKLLWNERYFRLYCDPGLGASEVCLANQLMGQWCVRLAGLEPLFDAESCQSILRQVERYNVQPTRFGLINGRHVAPVTATSPDLPHGSARAISIGENLCAAMTAMYEGHPGGELWARRVIWTIHEHLAMPFAQPGIVDHETGEPAGQVDHYANLAVWAVPMARSRLSLAAFMQDSAWFGELLGAAAPAV